MYESLYPVSFYGFSNISWHLSGQTVLYFYNIEKVTAFSLLLWELGQWKVNILSCFSLNEVLGHTWQTFFFILFFECYPVLILMFFLTSLWVCWNTLIWKISVCFSLQIRISVFHKIKIVVFIKYILTHLCIWKYLAGTFCGLVIMSGMCSLIFCSRIVLTWNSLVK